MSITRSKCWICGDDEPNSREHKIKKSDLKYLYPEATQTKPIFHRINGIRKRAIGSLNASALKYPKSICAACNGSLTQPYDHAWTKLSGFLHTHSQEIEKNNSLDIASVFQTDLQENTFSCILQNNLAASSLSQKSTSTFQKLEMQYSQVQKFHRCTLNFAAVIMENRPHMVQFLMSR